MTIYQASCKVMTKSMYTKTKECSLLVFQIAGAQVKISLTSSYMGEKNIGENIYFWQLDRFSCYNLTQLAFWHVVQI